MKRRGDGTRPCQRPTFTRNDLPAYDPHERKLQADSIEWSNLMVIIATPAALYSLFHKPNHMLFSNHGTLKDLLQRETLIPDAAT